jgi:hypothetical protein
VTNATTERRWKQDTTHQEIVRVEKILVAQIATMLALRDEQLADVPPLSARRDAESGIVRQVDVHLPVPLFALRKVGLRNHVARHDRRRRVHNATELTKRLKFLQSSRLASTVSTRTYGKKAKNGRWNNGGMPGEHRYNPNSI